MDGDVGLIDLYLESVIFVGVVAGSGLKREFVAFGSIADGSVQFAQNVSAVDDDASA